MTFAVDDDVVFRGEELLAVEEVEEEEPDLDNEPLIFLSHPGEFEDGSGLLGAW